MSEQFINFCKPSIGEDEIREVAECLKSGWLTTASRARQFEEDFAKYVDAKFAVAVNSCTAALHLALEAVGVGDGDLVLTPTMTFAATAEVVRHVGAIPVLIDCHENDFCMNMDRVEETLEDLKRNRLPRGVGKNGGRVKAVIPVHFAGQVADVERCRRLSDEHGFFQIEDCAHCCPAWYQDDDDAWNMVGQSADVACFSFYANKAITTGEGGMAVTDNAEWADRIRVMSLHGISKDAWKRFSKSGTWRYDIIAPGFKYNMPDIAASLGIHQLRKADRFLEERERVVKRYDQRLKNIAGLKLPTPNPGRRHSWHLYIVRVNPGEARVNRDEFIEKLKEKNVGSSVHYMPLHLHPYYRERFGYVPEDCPTAARLFDEIVSLPLYPDLTDDDVDRVCDAVMDILGKR